MNELKIGDKVYGEKWSHYANKEKPIEYIVAEVKKITNTRYNLSNGHIIYKHNERHEDGVFAGYGKYPNYRFLTEHMENVIRIANWKLKAYNFVSDKIYLNPFTLEEKVRIYELFHPKK